MIRAALTDARAELDTLRERTSTLEGQIAQAEALLEERRPEGPAPATLTLHEALAVVIREEGRGMTARQLADQVNARGLYRKRDGTPVQANQVHARVNNYDAIFRKDDSLIYLREASPALSEAPSSFTIFRDDDDAFFEWLETNPHGYFINADRNPKPSYLVLHRPDCPHFKGDVRLKWTKDYAKVCSTDRSALEGWARETVGGEVAHCGTCFD